MTCQYPDPNLITLTRHVQAKCSRTKSCSNDISDLPQLLTFIQTAVKAVRAACGTLIGNAGKKNVQGEDVKKLDVYANEIFINMLKSSFTTCFIVSEENENIIEVEMARRGKYIVCIDPLDGSSNIDCLLSVGSIFAIFKKTDNEKPSIKHVLQSGNNIVAAGFALYGTSTIMVVSVGDGVDSFTFDPTIGEFILMERNIRIPQRGNIYSVNESNENKWADSIKEYIKSLKDPGKGNTYSLRYVGALVADAYRTMKYGGIFLYPASTNAPKGKLRLLYECIPIAFLVIQAGGLASNGEVSILDVVPENIHERSPLFIGSTEDVETLLSIIKKHNK